MDITTSVITNKENAILRLYRESPEAREISVGAAQRRKVVQESVLSSGVSMCSVKDSNKFKRNSSALEMDKVKTAMGEQFSNIDAMKAASCAVGTAYHSLPTGLLSLSDTVNEYITNPRQIGSESVYGYAVLGGVSGVSDMVIAKSPRSGEGDDLEHEMFVAAVGTNKLRSMGIPNFAIVYGGFRCSRSVIDPDTKKVVNWCSSSVSGEVPYAVYENVAPSISAREYTMKSNTTQIVSMYVQFLVAISLANKHAGFTHCDAHNENVLMRDVSALFPSSKLFQIKYPDGTLITTDAVATLIDYGMSVVKYGDEYVGSSEPMTERHLYYSDRAYPLHDAYKFLMFTLRSLRERKDSSGVNSFGVLTRVFRFFNKTERVTDAIEKQWRFRYSLPYTKDKGVEDLLSYIKQQFPGITTVMSETRNKKLPLLDCKKCWTFEAASKELGAQGQRTPRDLVSYYDLSHTDAYQTIKREFDYESARGDFMKRLSSMLVTDNDLRAVVRLRVTELSTNVGVTKMKKWRLAVFDALHSLDRTRMYLRVAEFFVKERGDEELRDLAKRVSAGVVRLNNAFCASLKILRENLEDAKSVNDVWYGSQAAADVFLIKTSLCTNTNSKEESEELFVMSDEGSSLFPTSRTLTMDEKRGVILR